MAMIFKEYVMEYLKQNFTPGTKSWNDYEAAKYKCIAKFNPTVWQYNLMLQLITDWLEL